MVLALCVLASTVLVRPRLPSCTSADGDVGVRFKALGLLKSTVYMKCPEQLGHMTCPKGVERCQSCKPGRYRQEQELACPDISSERLTAQRT